MRRVDHAAVHHAAVLQQTCFENPKPWTHSFIHASFVSIGGRSSTLQVQIMQDCLNLDQQEGNKKKEHRNCPARCDTEAARFLRTTPPQYRYTIQMHHHRRSYRFSLPRRVQDLKSGCTMSLVEFGDDLQSPSLSTAFRRGGRSLSWREASMESRWWDRITCIPRAFG